MKLHRKRDFEKSGIYAIRNILNNKMYIGKSKCIYSRMHQHVTGLNRKSKDENRHLINSWHLHGRNAFEYIVLEYIPFDPELIKQRELYWQKVYKVTDRNKGYNFREDSETGMVCHQETRDKMSKSHIERYKDPKEREKCSHNFWKNNPDKLEKMSKKVSELNVKYFIDQYDKKTNIFIKRWDSIIELINIHPEYKKHNIYAVCSKEKPSMYGFIWKKVLKS